MSALASLVRAYERMDRKTVPNFGYARTEVGFCIVLRPDGIPAFTPVDLRSDVGKKVSAVVSIFRRRWFSGPRD